MHGAATGAATRVLAMHVVRVSLASLALLATLAGGGRARADVQPEVELVGGASHNLGGADVGYFFGKSYMLGLRGVGYFSAPADGHLRLGAELALDAMHYDWIPEAASAPGYSDPDVLRERLLAGARLEWRLSPRFQVFGRALVGLDHYASDAIASYQGPGTLVVKGSAFAAELGLGARVSFGHLVVGVQCGLPVAFYTEDQGHPGAVLSGGVMSPIASGALNVYLHETAIDVEGLVTVGVAF
jgi:hypothetical protein